MPFLLPRTRTVEGYHALRASISLGSLTLLALFGTIGYMMIEGWSLIDSMYMVFITLSTVGFREVHPLSPGGRIFTSVLVMLGVGLVAFLVGNLIEFSLQGHLLGLRRKQIMDKQIRSMRGHYIVCGYGRVGQEVVAELTAKGHTAVVIDLDPPREQLEEHGIPYLVGNAQSEENLLEAGIERARGLFAAMDSDTENVFTILTARSLKPGLHLIARASERDTSRKLKMVGADRVVSPYVISGRRMAAMAIQPDVVDFLDYFTQPLQEIALEIVNVEVRESSELAGRSIQDVDLRRRSGAMVLAIRTPAGLQFNPSADVHLDPGAKLVILGTVEQVQRLEEMARS